MAWEELPLLHKFLGANSSDDQHNHQPHIVLTEVSVTSSSSTELGYDQGSYVLNNRWQPSENNSRNSSPQLLSMGMDASDGLRLYKKLRVEQADDSKKRHEESTLDELNLTMQPPRVVSSNLYPSAMTHLDFLKVASKHWDSSIIPHSAMFGSGRVGQRGLNTEATNSLKDNIAGPLLNISPADEGSRTGLKGSSIGSLLDQATPGSGLGLSLGQSKSLIRAVGSESTHCASQEITSITRQLTIFYGGQAHVYEDVSVDKAEAIIALAGSTGRSWSTVYSQPKSSMPLSVAEGSLSIYDRDKAKGGNKPSSSHHLETSSGFSADVQNNVNSFLHKGHSCMGDSHVHEEHPNRCPKWPTDIHLITAFTDHMNGKKPAVKSQVSMNVGDFEKEPFASL
ncbi:hypothetical protein KP509_03G092300 [Ceratopteris richardii]|uniref:Tify domain-containing protein n=2 Tax=Ceratopteris richardii TaxID=49495 RepID=A0A8T2VDJ6_CERRI|nr:hypothetical protein KP509_03G092300 [Ceratopteris richardii]